MKKNVAEIPPQFMEKIYRIVCGCNTPQQLTVASRYLKLAREAGYIHGLDFSMLEFLDHQVNMRNHG